MLKINIITVVAFMLLFFYSSEHIVNMHQKTHEAKLTAIAGSYLETIGHDTLQKCLI